MSTTWIKVAYAALLGLVVAVTVGFGVASFITEPRLPQPLGITFTQLSDQNASAQDNSRQAKQIDGLLQDGQNYRANYPDYQRNIFLAFAGIGMIVAILGVALPAVVNYLRLGFVTGGVLLIAAGAYFAVQPVPNPIPPSGSVLTLLGIGQPTVLDAAGRFLRFAVSVVGLLVLLFVGLWRLTDWVMTPRMVAPAAVAPAAPAASVVPVAAPPVPSDPLRWARPEDQPPAPPSYTPSALPTTAQTVVDPVPVAAAEERPIAPAAEPTSRSTEPRDATPS
jgi:hypothetical protein